MGEQDEILEDLYVLWVEAQVLHYGLQGDVEALVPGTEPRAVVDPTASEAGRRLTLGESSEGQVDNEPPTGPIEEATPARDVPPSEEGSWDDVAERTEFDPQLFWMLLEQAGYELW